MSRMGERSSPRDDKSFLISCKSLSICFCPALMASMLQAMIEGDAEAPGALRERHLELHALLIQRHHARLCGLPEMAVGFGIPEVGVRIKLIHVLDQQACGLRGKRRVFHGRFLSLALEVSSWLASSLVRRAEPFSDRDYL